MKSHLKYISTAALFFAINSVSVAGPLGLEMGTSLAQIKSKSPLKTEEPYQFSTPTLPDGHPDFNDYRMIITPQHGLCKLIAWTPAIRTNVYGTELLSAFERYFSVLTTKYGSAKRYDFLRSGSIWNEEKDWMMALRKKERTLVAFWTEKEVQLPDNLSAIKIEAYANGTESGMISIGYEFKNSDECIDWIKSKKDSKL